MEQAQGEQVGSRIEFYYLNRQNCSSAAVDGYERPLDQNLRPHRRKVAGERADPKSVDAIGPPLTRHRHESDLPPAEPIVHGLRREGDHSDQPDYVELEVKANAS